MINEKMVKKVALNLGADLCGIASVDRFKEAPAGFHPRDVYEEAESAIVFARRYPADCLNAKTRVPYTFMTEIIKAEVYRITVDLAVSLANEDIGVVPIPSEPYDYWDAENKIGKGILSLKHAGYLAGLGVLGKNTLLYDSKYGSMITLGAVLIDRKLKGDPLAGYYFCKDNCSLCIKSCPQKALDGFSVNQKLCREYSELRNSKGYLLYTCSLCKTVCPNKNGVVKS